MKIHLTIWFSFCLLSVFNFKCKAQDYLKIYEDDINYAETKIKRLKSGDIILATSSLESLRNGGKNASLFCQRLDYCGQVIWSYAYKIQDDHIILNDLALLNNDEIVLFGSIYEGLKESIFLFKINAQTGINDELKVFNPGTVDHFTYSMDIKDEKIIIYGLLLDFNTKKNGFIAQFNSRLNFIWANKLLPFELSGKAVISGSNAIFCYSGSTVFALNNKGLPHWTLEIKGEKTLKIIGGPYLVKDGIIFEAQADTLQFLFKLNEKGEKIWESDRYASLGKSSAISFLNDGSIYLSILKNNVKHKSIEQLIFSNNGKLQSNTTLFLPITVNSTILNQDTDSYLTNTIIGSIDPFISKKGEINSFLLQYSLNNSPLECLQVDTTTLKKNNYNPLILEAIIPQISGFNIIQEKVFRPDTLKWNRIFNSSCQIESKTTLLNMDTTLNCEESWKITLPGEDYIWSDNYVNKERNITKPGVYKAYKLSCTDPGVFYFTLKKRGCDCPIFIPNAFSPNNDGINDIVSIYSPCEIVSYEWKIFSRWGSLITQGMNKGWNGTKSGATIPQDTYVLNIKYKIKDTEGITHEGQKVQILNLIR